jgi:hypothetical protein
MSGNVSRRSWPARWQPEVCALLEPLIGSDNRIDFLVGPPESSIDGSRYAGFLYEGAGNLMLIHDRSGRPDVYPWRLPIGPVLRLEVIEGARKRKVVYRHPTWNERERR